MTSARALLRDRTVMLLLAAEGLASLSGTIVLTALGWQAFSRAHDSLVLGLIGLAEFLPAALLALPAGHVADRYDRRLVGGLGLLGATAVTVALAIDAAAGDREVWPLYLMAFGAGIAQAFVAPAFNPLLLAAVPSSAYSRIAAMSASTWQSAAIAGPALGGLLQGFGDPDPYVAATIAGFLAAAALVLVPRAVGVGHVTADDVPQATLRDALAGVRLIFATPPLLGAISLDLCAVLFGGATALLPAFSQAVLHVGPFANGVLRAAPGVGAVLVGVYLAARPIRRHVGAALLIAVAAFGVFTVLFGLSRNYVLALVALSLLAAADMVSVFVRGTLGPLLTPPALRGRVGAVERVFIGASNELGAFESGVAAAALGIVPAIVIGGVASIVIAGLWAWRFPGLRSIDRFEDLDLASPPSA